MIANSPAFQRLDLRQILISPEKTTGTMTATLARFLLQRHPSQNVMKTTVHSVGAAVLLISTTIAHSQDWLQNWYVTGDAGAVFQQVASLRQSTAPPRTATFDPGVRSDVAVGYDFGDSFAAELEAGFMWNSVDKVSGVSLSSIGQSVDLYSVPILANFIYKVPTKRAWIPYLGVGVGGYIGILKSDPGNNTDTDIEPALQAEVGLKYKFASNVSIGIAYKFLATLDQRYFIRSINDRVTIGDVYIHGVFVTFTVNF